MAVKRIIKETLDKLATQYYLSEFRLVSVSTFKYEFHIGELRILWTEGWRTESTIITISTVLHSQFCQTNTFSGSLAILRCIQARKFITEWVDAYIAYKVTDRGRALNQFLWGCQILTDKQITCLDVESRRIGYKNFSDFVHTICGLVENKAVYIDTIMQQSATSQLRIDLLSPYKFGFNHWCELHRVFQTQLSSDSKFHIIPTAGKPYILSFVFGLGEQHGK